MTWRATVLTLFPEMVPGPLGHSLAGRGLERGLWSLEAVDIRGFARDKHRSVDDTPFGGGAGMVMRPDVIDAAIDAVADARAAAVLLASTKDRAEHQITIDMVLDTVLPFCSYVDSEPEPSIVSLANVQHLATLVEGRLSSPPASALALVAALVLSACAGRG